MYRRKEPLRNMWCCTVFRNMTLKTTVISLLSSDPAKSCALSHRTSLNIVFSILKSTRYKITEAGTVCSASFLVLQGINLMRTLGFSAL